MALPKDQKSQIQLLLGIVAILGMFGYYQMIHTGRAAEAEALQQRVDQLSMQNDAMRAIVARYGTDLPRRIAIYEEHVRQLEQLIPRQEDVPVLISQITQRAYQLGVELAGLNPGPVEPGEYYSRQSYDVHVLGEYHRIGEYLTAIASLSRIIRPSSVRLNVEGGRSSSDENPELRGAFRIDTYIMPTGPGPNEIASANAN